MSELQGPRIPGEERSGRRRPLGWIIGGLIALLLLALLIPFACQALRGGSGSRGAGSGAQGETTTAAQENDRAQGSGRAAEKTTDSGTADNKAGGRGSDVSARLASIGEVKGANGTTVTIPQATIAGTDGWISVHQDAGGKPKMPQSIGHAPLREGKNTGIKVKLDRPLTSSQRLYAMVHADDPTDGRYTFPSGDPSAKASGKKLALESFRYVVSGGRARSKASVERAQAGEAKPLPDTGGMSPVVLLVVGTILLLIGGGLSAAVSRRGASRG
jgi:LPXTG-motif cell wall-anchored protein